MLAFETKYVWNQIPGHVVPQEGIPFQQKNTKKTNRLHASTL